MKPRFHFKSSEYRKYPDFKKVDDTLDKHTTIRIDKHLAGMIKDFRRFSDKVILYDNTGDYATVEGYYAFNKALASHMAFVWYDAIPHYDLALKDMQRVSRSNLMNVRSGNYSRDKTAMHVIMPRYTTGLFEYPVPSVDVFPMGMAFEYAFCIYAMENKLQFFNDDNNYVVELLNNLKYSIDGTINDLEHRIVPRL